MAEATETSLPEITKKDLAEERPFKLNSTLAFLTEHLAAVQGAQGPFVFGVGPYTFRGVVTLSEEANFDSTANFNSTSNFALEASFDALPRIGALADAVYSNNNAAKAGGLTAGQLYRTSNGDVKVVYD